MPKVQVSRNQAPGIVVIGRNEGVRLMNCLASLPNSGVTVVYVDSGSTDYSPDVARSYGAQVVHLDLTQPFTAARARNAGYARLMQVAPTTEFVQFVDGDCMLDPQWLRTAAHVLHQQAALGVVCGRRRELAPEASIYNKLCDIEWDTPIGFASACGGDALMRTEALRVVGGFDATMIAGEEPELCVRLIRRGYQVLRLDAEMTVHDAAMTRWTQWWSRALRTGHTTAELLDKHGHSDLHRRLRRASSALFWAVAVPLASLLLVTWARRHGFPALALASALPLAAYCLLFVRIQRRCAAAGRTEAEAQAYAGSCLLAKWPEVCGMLLYAGRRMLGRKPTWIEYKDGPRGGRWKGSASKSGTAMASEANGRGLN